MVELHIMIFVDNIMMMMNQMGRYHHDIHDMLNFHLVSSRVAAHTQQTEQHGSLVHVEVFRCLATALWVKNGNRGNLKSLKVNDNYVLIFHRKMFISFLSGAKLSTFYD